MENKRRRKKGKTGPEPEERDERVKNTGRRDEMNVKIAAGQRGLQLFVLLSWLSCVSLWLGPAVPPVWL